MAFSHLPFAMKLTFLVTWQIFEESLRLGSEKRGGRLEGGYSLHVSDSFMYCFYPLIYFVFVIFLTIYYLFCIVCLGFLFLGLSLFGLGLSKSSCFGLCWP